MVAMSAEPVDHHGMALCRAGSSAFGLGGLINASAKRI
jgi:hypothetical protein